MRRRRGGSLPMSCRWVQKQREAACLDGLRQTPSEVGPARDFRRAAAADAAVAGRRRLAPGETTAPRWRPRQRRRTQSFSTSPCCSNTCKKLLSRGASEGTARRPQGVRRQRRSLPPVSSPVSRSRGSGMGRCSKPSRGPSRTCSIVRSRIETVPGFPALRIAARAPCCRGADRCRSGAGRPHRAGSPAGAGSAVRLTRVAVAEGWE